MNKFFNEAMVTAMLPIGLKLWNKHPRTWVGTFYTTHRHFRTYKIDIFAYPCLLSRTIYLVELGTWPLRFSEYESDNGIRFVDVI